MDGSANNVLCRGGHFCEITGVLRIEFRHKFSLNSQTLSENFIAQMVKTFREEGMILKESLTGHKPTVPTNEKKCKY